jgi:hypothetical protein
LTDALHFGVRIAPEKGGEGRSKIVQNDIRRGRLELDASANEDIGLGLHSDSRSNEIAWDAHNEHVKSDGGVLGEAAQEGVVDRVNFDLRGVQPRFVLCFVLQDGAEICVGTLPASDSEENVGVGV